MIIFGSHLCHYSINIGRLQFKDSFGFMAFSLEKLTEFLMKGEGEAGFKQTKAVFEPKYGNNWTMP